MVDDETIRDWMSATIIRAILVPWAFGELSDAEFRAELDKLQWERWTTFFFDADEIKELTRLAVLAEIGE